MLKTAKVTGDGKKTFLSSKNVSFRTIRFGYEKNWNVMMRQNIFLFRLVYYIAN